MKNKIILSIQQQLFQLTKQKFSKKYIETYIIKIIEYIVFSKNNKFLISGSQGIGKSTLLKIIKSNINIYYKKSVLCLSLDDYYLSKLKREKLSKKIHPLLITRGVPGTHEIKKIIKDLKSFDNFNYPLTLPIFNKLSDDVSKKKRKINQKHDILILEGWCCGSTPIKKDFLYRNINVLESSNDVNMVWRNYYNNMLKKDYNNLLKLFNNIIYLKAPSFDYVANWRLKQERMLKKKNQIIMRKKAINEFILHYEKITKWMIKILPKKSNMVIFIKKNQKIKKIFINKNI